MNYLKNQILSYKQILSHKEEEIKILKQNSKVGKFSNLEIEFNQLNEEFNVLKEHNTQLNQNYTEYSLFNFKEN